MVSKYFWPFIYYSLSWWRGLHNSVKLWAMPCWATLEGQLIVKSSDKMWCTGERNGNHFHILAWKTPWTLWKRKKIWCWKMSHPKSEGKEHFQDGCLGGMLPPPVGDGKCVLCPVIAVAGSLLPEAFWLRGISVWGRGLSDPVQKISWWPGTALTVWFPLSVLLAVSSLWVELSLRPDASVNFASFSVACLHVLCVREEAGPMPLSEGSGYLSICFSRGCPH